MARDEDANPLSLRLAAGSKSVLSRLTYSIVLNFSARLITVLCITNDLVYYLVI